MFFLIEKIKRRLKKLVLSFGKLFKKERQPYSEFIRLFNYYNETKKAADVLFFGDSVAERVSWSDIDNRTLTKFVALNLKNTTDVAAISYGGFTLEVFYHFVLALEKMKNKPKMVILPINMRNFSPQWDLEPTWQFQKEIELIKEFIADPSIVPSLGQIKKEALPQEVFNVFDGIPVSYPLSPLNHVGQFRLVINATPTTGEQKNFRLSQIFIFHYTNIVTPDHPKIVFLRNSISLLQKMRIPVVTYITPVNVEAGIRLVGSSFSESLSANVQVVSDIVKESFVDERISFKDWSGALKSEYFFHPDNATEHLNESGRRVLASAIAVEVQEMLGKNKSSPRQVHVSKIMD